MKGREGDSSSQLSDIPSSKELINRLPQTSSPLQNRSQIGVLTEPHKWLQPTHTASG